MPSDKDYIYIYIYIYMCVCMYTKFVDKFVYTYIQVTYNV